MFNCVHLSFFLFSFFLEAFSFFRVLLPFSLFSFFLEAFSFFRVLLPFSLFSFSPSFAYSTEQMTV